MRNLSLITLCLPLLLSCGDPASAEPAPRDEIQVFGLTPGKRISPIYNVGSDGSRIPAMNTFWDRERNEQCSLTPGPSGLYCAPYGTTVTSGNAASYVSFVSQH